jgi:UDP-2-acetamido-3-amino-2,3-dideoxy-glucuronate N-acetyltransferase
MSSVEINEVEIGPHCIIDPGTAIGSHTSIGAHSVIEFGVSIGSGSTVGAGAHLGAGLQIGDAVNIEARVTFASNGNGAIGASSPSSRVNDGAIVGAGSVIYAGTVIHAKALVRPGSVVMRSVPPGAIVEGNPAAIVGYADAAQGTGQLASPKPNQASNVTEASPVNGVTVHTFPVIRDLRGDLTAGEFGKHIPFTPKRYFMVFGVPSKEVRGEHAHRECHQFLLCVRGSCAVVADDGTRRMEIVLDEPNRGIYLPPMTWGIQYKYSADALLLVFASHHYDSADYIRDYSEFIELAAKFKP